LVITDAQKKSWTSKDFRNAIRLVQHVSKKAHSHSVDTDDENDMPKLICSDHPYLPLPTVFATGYRAGDVPAIVILDAAAAAAIARQDLKSAPAVDHAQRLQDAIDFIRSAASPPFEIGSLIYTTEPNFMSGRHRTLALASEEFKTVPFLVSERAAHFLKAHWGIINDALLEYDFSFCKTKLLIGR
jgi:hypothetical protein